MRSKSFARSKPIQFYKLLILRTIAINPLSLFASVLIPLFVLLTGCVWHGIVELEKVHVRGEYDFSSHIIKDCATGASYDLVLGSADAFKLFRRFEKLGKKPDDSPSTFPVIMEFDAVLTYYQMPFSRRRSIACVETPQITPGTCISGATKKKDEFD